MRQRPKFELAVTRALVVGLSLAVVAIVLLFLASNASSGTWTTAVSNFASTILSIGVITVVYDVFIRGSFANELLDAVQVSGSLRSAAIRDISRETEVSWQDLLIGGRDFHVLLTDPTAWVEREWPHILAAGRLREVHVHIYLPDTQGSAFPTLARQVLLSVDDFRNRVERNSQLLQEGWKNAEPPLLQSSTIDIRLYDAVPAYNLVLVDHMTVLLVHGCLGKAPGDTALTLRFVDPSDRFPTGWFRGQVRSFEQLSLEYSNKV